MNVQWMRFHNLYVEDKLRRVNIPLKSANQSLKIVMKTEYFLAMLSLMKIQDNIITFFLQRDT